MALRLKMVAAAALAVIAAATAASASDPLAVETLPAGTSSWSPAGRFPDAVPVGDKCRFTDACNGGRTVTRAGWSWYTDGCGNRNLIKPNCGVDVNIGAPGPGCPTVCLGATAWRAVRDRFTCDGGLYAVLPGCTVVPLAPRWVFDLAARPADATPVARAGQQCRLTDTCRAGAAVTLTRGEPYVDGCGNTLVAAGYCRVDANAGTGAIGPGCPVVCQGDPAAAVTVRQVREVYECPGSGVLMEVYPGCHARFLTTLD